MEKIRNKIEQISNLPQKQRWVLILFFIFFAGLFFFADSNVSHAQFSGEALDNINNAIKENGGSPDVTFWGNVGLKIVNSALYVVFQVSVVVLAIGKWFLDTMTNPVLYSEVFLNPHSIAAINTAWAMVRDFFNMIFILIILMIAIGIILRVPKFGDKKNLLYVILAALLINFSKPIALAIIDVSQLGMNFFINAINGNSFVFTDTLLNSMNLEEIWSADLRENTGIALTMVMSSIFLLVLGFMLFVLAVTLLIRMVAFYVLIILSPFAMFGLALKGTGSGKMSNDWFEKMTSWAFYGPIMTFFLYIALTLVNAIAETTLGKGGDASYFKSYFGTNALDPDGKSLFGKILGMLIPYTAAIYLLYYGYDLSKKMSTGAAKSILEWGDKKLGEWSGRVVKGAGSIAKAPWTNYVQPRLKGRMEGYRNRIGGPLKTKEVKEKDIKDRFEKSKAKAGGVDKYSEYERKKAYEKKKEFDASGVSEKERARIEKKGNVIEKKALEMHKIDNNEIQTGADLGKALAILSSDKTLKKTFENKWVEKLKKSDDKPDAKEFNNIISAFREYEDSSEDDFKKRRATENKYRKIIAEGKDNNEIVAYDFDEMVTILESVNDAIIAQGTKSNAMMKKALEKENTRLENAGQDKLETNQEITNYFLGRGDYGPQGSRRTSTAHLYSGGFATSAGRFNRGNLADMAMLRRNAYYDYAESMKLKNLTDQKAAFFNDTMSQQVERVVGEQNLGGKFRKEALNKSPQQQAMLRQKTPRIFS